MNVEEINSLIDRFAQSGITRMKYSSPEVSLELEREITYTVPVAGEIAPTAATIAAAEPVMAQTDGHVQEAFYEVKSPLVGAFYGKSAPDAAPFVQVGVTVHPGDTLCIIEAMKVMNEIKCPVSGVVREVMATDEDVVEFDQVLFRIEEEHV